jgi:exonuclease III
VHPNPGPPQTVSHDLAFMTYNCRGLADNRKVRRLFAKLNILVNNNYVIALQETHLIDDKTFEMYWHNGFIKNCSATNKCGVAILFSSEYKVNQVFKDDKDRIIIAELENDKRKLIVGDVYYPNDHKEAISFNEMVYNKMLEFQYRSSDASSCLMGDMNQCLSNEDSVNRNKTKTETELTNLTVLNNESSCLIDSYRTLERQGGYTWRRGDCLSRLDYIFVSDDLKHKIINVQVDWCVDKSDHAAVICKLKTEVDIIKGKGITKLNVDLLDNNDRLKEITLQVRQLKEQIPNDWNPHSRLEFTKVAIRTAMATEGGSYNKEKHTLMSDVEVQINRLNKTREVEFGKDRPNTDLLKKIDEACQELSNELEDLRNKYSDNLAFKAGVKWYEEGEKSNKYFLGLMKARAKRKLITEISNGGEVNRGQNGIMKCVREFYENLYKRNECKPVDEDKDFFKLCPKLSDESRKDLDRDITSEELLTTLKSCKESASGPDGLTYKVYKKLWPIIGEEIAKSW